MIYKKDLQILWYDIKYETRDSWLSGFTIDSCENIYKKGYYYESCNYYGFYQ